VLKSQKFVEQVEYLLSKLYGELRTMTSTLMLFFLTFLEGVSVSAQLYPNSSDATATGYRAYIEEYRHDLQHPDFYPSQQFGHIFLDLHSEQAEKAPLSAGCLQSLKQGMVEFSDFGPMNNLPFKDLFVVSPGHSDVTGISHFAFLDAYGARLKGAELEVLVSSDMDTKAGEEEGFLTKGGERVKSLLIHYETAALGYGRGDSQALAPPLQIRAVTKRDITAELSALANSGDSCYCNLLVPHDVCYAIGLLYYPQYGHTLFNGLSNIVTTLWRKNISYSDVEIAVFLYRNTSTQVQGVPSRTYQLLWQDMFDEVFKFFSTEVVQWAHIIDQAMLANKTICFPRILVGALPHLDLMNISAPQALYSRYSHEIIANLYLSELQQLYHTMKVDTALDITSDQLHLLVPTQYPDYYSRLNEATYDDSSAAAWKSTTIEPYCAVTIVTRDVENARSIVNAKELLAFSKDKGCKAQIVSMERLSLKEQVGEVRWNTTLFVSVDGSALFNALFMQECSTVLYVEMWRRAMMYPKFEPAAWVGYIPSAADTSFPNMSDPIAQHLHGLISTYTARGRQAELESLDLSYLPFSNKDIEDFLRNKQSVQLPIDEFDRILSASINHNHRCRIPVTSVSRDSKSLSPTMVFKMR